MKYPAMRKASPCFLIGFMALALFGLGFAPARSQPSPTVSLQFGEQTLVLERGMVPRRPVMNPPSKEKWLRIERYEMRPNQVVALYLLPEQIQLCASSFRTLLLKRNQVKINNFNLTLPENRYAFNDIVDRIESTSDLDKKFMPSTRVYEFRADDLRNVFGRQLRFVTYKLPDQTETSALLQMQLTTEIRMRVTFAPQDCFLENGDKIVRRFRELILSRLK